MRIHSSSLESSLAVAPPRSKGLLFLYLLMKFSRALEQGGKIKRKSSFLHTLPHVFLKCYCFIISYKSSRGAPHSKAKNQCRYSDTDQLCLKACTWWTICFTACTFFSFTVFSSSVVIQQPWENFFQIYWCLLNQNENVNIQFFFHVGCFLSITLCQARTG